MQVQLVEYIEQHYYKRITINNNNFGPSSQEYQYVQQQQNDIAYAPLIPPSMNTIGNYNMWSAVQITIQQNYDM